MQNNLNPETSKASQLIEALDRQSIEGLVFDLDDTLIHTDPVFRTAKANFKESVCDRYSLDREQFEIQFQRINLEAQQARGVNPDRWEYVVKQLASVYGSSYKFFQHHQLFMDIYSVVPEVKEGAIELLEMLQLSGRKLGLVTHANVDWTRFKLESTGLGSYFDSVIIADENRHKSSEDWGASLVDLELRGSGAIVVGDNVVGDIQAGIEAGFGHQVHVPAAWSYYASGDLPETALFSPTGIAGVADTLIENL